VDVLKVGTDKDFGDIPIPELVGFGGEIGVGLEVEGFGRADVEEVEILLRPLEEDLGAMAGDGAAVIVVCGDDGGGVGQKGGVRSVSGAES